VLNQLIDVVHPLVHSTYYYYEIYNENKKRGY
jgi:hypothetical protein